METEAMLVLLLVLATSVAIATTRLRVPYTVALVGAGLVLGPLQLIEPPHLTRELLFFVFLPGLLFEAAYHLEYADFRRHVLPIGALAVPGVVAAAGLTALVITPLAGSLHLATGFGWAEGLAFGAIIAATDPIAVVALFKKLGAPRELGVLMEGESLLNDGTSIVVFTLIVAAAAGGSVHAGQLVLDFAVTVGGGALLGIGVGLAVAEVMKRIDDPMIEITLTTIAAYGSFVAAEHFHVSGVIATVAAGMLCGNYAATRGMTPSTRISVETFWEYVAFALNSLVFLLIGFEVHVGDMLGAWLPILVAYLAVLLSRGVVAGGVSALLRARGRPMPWRWTAVLWWGGLRGGISMVLALSLAPDFPHRDLLVTMTFGVVTLVILAHGLTVSPLLVRLGLAGRREVVEDYELTRGRLQLARRALDVIGDMRASGTVDPSLLEPMEGQYRDQLATQEERLRSLHLEHADLRASEISRTLRQVLLEERRQATESYRSGLISRDVFARLAADIDARLVEAREGWRPKGEEVADGMRTTPDRPLERSGDLAGEEPGEGRGEGAGEP
jgi:CPA1 family monovalent cation:H+ antiporter